MNEVFDVWGKEGELWVADCGVEEEGDEVCVWEGCKICPFLRRGVSCGADRGADGGKGVRTSSRERPSAATRPSVPSMTFCFERSQGPQSHSFSRTFTTSLSMGGSWQYW